MPLYDMVCDKCEEFHEDVLVPVTARHSQLCVCGDTLRPIPPSVALVGPTDTQPYTMGGETFTSKAALESWQKQTGKHEISTSSVSYQRMKNKAYTSAEKQVKKAGFDGVDDFKKRRAQYTLDQA